jgi:hypothetical protein
VATELARRRALRLSGFPGAALWGSAPVGWAMARLADVLMVDAPLGAPPLYRSPSSIRNGAELGRDPLCERESQVGVSVSGMLSDSNNASNARPTRESRCSTVLLCTR